MIDSNSPVRRLRGRFALVVFISGDFFEAENGW